jgi:DNA-binding transcriptional MerR regulator
MHDRRCAERFELGPSRPTDMNRLSVPALLGGTMPRPARVGYTLPEVAAAAEVEYRTLHIWLRRGLIRASLESASGSGTSNRFNESDVLEARILADLRRLGAEMSVLERTAAALQRRSRRLAGDETLIINGQVTVLPAQKATEVRTCEPSFVFATSHAKDALLRVGLTV